ncbi:MAG: universal stress protein, partial [Acidimicrobiales bacterium]
WVGMDDRIVVGTDGSDSAAKAVAEATRLARALGGEVHIVSAYRPEHVSGSSLPARFAGSISSQAQVEAVLDDASSRARIAGVVCTTHAVKGDPADALVEVVEQVGGTMLVVGNKGLNSKVRFLLGSVPTKVVHHAPCTTVIVHTM